MINKKDWTNKDILHEFFWQTIDYRYRIAKREATVIKNTELYKDETKFEAYLVKLLRDAAIFIFSYLDGTSGPAEWPGIALVNAETGEKLSDNLARDYSLIEKEYLNSLDQ
ncbi:MAG: hypothetical protein JXA42_01365 [Anaerolineales bacterium]|nr:hypothetical protein [Anaerolineales bacterium]